MFDGPGAGGLFAQLAQCVFVSVCALQPSLFSCRGFPGGYGPQRRNPRSYDEYMKAYSVAMLPGKERTNLSYGGKSTFA